MIRDQKELELGQKISEFKEIWKQQSQEFLQEDRQEKGKRKSIR